MSLASRARQAFNDHKGGIKAGAMHSVNPEVLVSRYKAASSLAATYNAQKLSEQEQAAAGGNSAATEQYQGGGVSSDVTNKLAGAVSPEVTSACSAADEAMGNALNKGLEVAAPAMDKVNDVVNKANEVVSKIPGVGQATAIKEQLSQKTDQVLGGAQDAVGKVTGALGKALGLGNVKLPGVKHFDPILGIDVHMWPNPIMPPHIPFTPPIPIPPASFPMPAPYIGLIFDLGEYIAEASQFLAGVGLSLASMAVGMMGGGSVYVNGRHKGIASTGIKNLPHWPWMNPASMNSGEILMGSSTVLIGKEPCGYMALPCLDCNLVGIPSPFRMDKEKKMLGLGLPTSFQLPLPQPKPVIIGGGPTISMRALANKVKGAVGDKAKAWMKECKIYKAVCGKGHDVIDGILDKSPFKNCDFLRNGAHTWFCSRTGHPIDVVSGYVTTDDQRDITLPGPLPFIWERCYYSDSSYRGPLGYGWYHNYDYQLLDDSSLDYVFIQMPDGRGNGTRRPKPGKPSLMPDIRMHLCVTEKGTYYLQDYKGTQYHFAQGAFHYEGDTSRLYPLSCIQDSHNNQIRFRYHEHNGHLYAIIDSAGRLLNVATDKLGRITGIRLDDGHQSHLLVGYVYQDQDLVQVLDAVHQPFSYEYQNHLLVKETNRVGTSYYFRWDDVSKGAKARATATWGRSPFYPEPFHARELHYDDKERMTTVIDGRDTTMAYHWHPVLPVVSREVDPFGHGQNTKFDDYHNPVSSSDAMGNSSKSEYDIANRLISQTDAKGNKTEYIYPDPGEDGLIYDRPSEIREMGKTTTFVYNEQGDVISRKSDNEWIEQSYHPTGQVQLAVDQFSDTPLLQREYDDHGLLITEFDRDHQPTRYEYDYRGLPTKISSTCFGDTLMQYDACGHLTERRQQDMAAEQFAYNAEGQMIRHQDASGAVTEMDYQGLPVICRRTYADSHSVHYEYDRELNLTALVNENRERYELYYDDKERLIKEVAFDGSVISYQYAPNDFLIRRQAGGYGWQKHTRDPLGRLEAIVFEDGSSCKFGYDDQNRLTEAVNQHHTTRFEYNEMHQLVAQIQDGHRIDYETCPTHHRVTLPDGHCLTYHTGAGQTLSKISMDNQVLSSYDYDEKGFEIKQCLGATTLLQEYDPYGRLIEQCGEYAHQPKLITRRHYTYDKAGRVAQIQRQFGGSQQFDYDNRGWLKQTTTGGKSLRYRHDAAGNLIHDCASGTEQTLQPIHTLHLRRGEMEGMDAPYIRHNQLTGNDDRRYEYDKYGNRVLESAENGRLQTHYYYDTQNQLTLLQKTVENKTTLVMNFTYDALGRRCAKFVTRYHDNQPVSQTRTSFLWDGNVLLAEQQAQINLLQDEALPPVSFSQPDAVYIHHPDSYEPLMQLRPPAEAEQPQEDSLPQPQFSTYYYLNDHQGTPQELLDKQGNIVWQALTSPYGEITDLKASKIPNPVRLPGQYADEESGLHYNRYRYYHPQDGCYLSRDPIGLQGGMNFYDYPRDPVNWMDPLGLQGSCSGKKGKGTSEDEGEGHSDSNQKGKDKGKHPNETDTPSADSGIGSKKNGGSGKDKNSGKNKDKNKDKNKNGNDSGQLTDKAGSDSKHQSKKNSDTATHECKAEGENTNTSSVGSKTHECKEGGEPIDLLTGKMFEQRTDFSVVGLMPLTHERYYHSGELRIPGLMGTLWRSSWDRNLKLDDGTVTFTDMNYNQSVFDLPYPDMPTRSPLMPGWELRRGSHRELILKHKDGLSYWFELSAGNVFLLTCMCDAYGNKSNFFYEHGILKWVMLSDRRLIQVETEHQCITRMTLCDPLRNPLRELANFTYDKQGRLIKVRGEPGCNFDYQYDEAGRLVRWNDLAKTWVEHRFDDKGRVVATRCADELWVDQLTYDDDNHIHYYKSAFGGVTAYHLDERNLPYMIVDAEGNKTEQQWQDDLLVRETNAAGETTVYTHDEWGNMTSVTLPDGTKHAYTYNEKGWLKKYINPAGSAWLYEHNPQGDVTQITDPDGRSWQYTYTRTGLRESATAPDGSTTRYQYNGHGQLTRIEPSVGYGMTVYYDALNRLIKRESDNKQVRRWCYEGKQSQPSQVIYEDGTTAGFQYDIEGNLIQVTDALGNVQRFDYGAFDKLRAATDPLGATTRYHYNAEAEFAGVTNSKGDQWLYEFDALGRITTERHYDGRKESFSYDQTGRMVQRTKPDGHHYRYQYDLCGRLLEAQSFDSHDNPTGKRWYKYDEASRLTSAENSDARVEMSYSPAGLLLSENLNGTPITHEYDAAGRRTAMNGTHTARAYQWQQQQLMQLHMGDHDPLKFAYHASGQESSRTSEAGFGLFHDWSATGLLTRQSLGAGYAPAGRGHTLREYHYDALDQLTRIDDTRRGHTEFTLNPNGQISAMRQRKSWETKASFVQLFGYDSELNLNQTGTGSESSGNVISMADERLKREKRRYDKAGRIMETGRFKYVYDPCGRVMSKTETQNGFRPQTTRFIWNDEDRLTHIELPDGKRYRYRYDPFGRRIAKECLKTQTATHYLWDGNTVVQQSKMTADGTAVQSTEYLYEPDTFRPLAQITTDHDTGRERLHYIVTDHAGTPQELCSPDGEVQWQGEQHLWGKFRQQRTQLNRGYLEEVANDSVTCDLRYQGQIEDSESGLYYNLNRYYDADSGQYLSPDPIGMVGGLRPQGYVDNPLGYVDPLGLSGCSADNEKVAISRNSARKLLKSRGLNKQIQHDTVNSFDGQIYASRGKAGDVFTITEHTPGSASQVYVTRGSAGATAAERRANLALPPNNSATYEGKVALTRDQVLLEGKVAPQLQWGQDKVGGGWQIVTAGGKYSGATELL